jgi:cyclopropane-fatty-acyl-phospholipid synthase
MLDALLADHVKDGALLVRLPGDRNLAVGGATAQTAPVIVRVVHARTLRQIAANPALALGEAYMNGDLRMERGTIYDLLDLIGRNLKPRTAGAFGRMLTALGAMFTERNGRRRAACNARHYELSLNLYRAFLDEDLHYSCAYYALPDLTLEEAQAAKKRHIAGKLLLRPGLSVLDIGCGWGGLGLSLVEDERVNVLGISLAGDQVATARSRALERGLVRRARFEQLDYRDVKGPFDRIVSVGMFEHVGRPNYGRYFKAIASNLKDDGVALVHTIGRSRGPGKTQPWIAKYIFPGGYIPALSEMLPAIERAGLIVTDIEVLRLHYAQTLRAWRERFKQREKDIRMLYDARFCRMWEFYLAASEIAFRHTGHVAYQLQLAKRIDTVPLTRDYITDHDRYVHLAGAAMAAE